MREHLRFPTAELARAERSEGARPALRDLGRVDDRQRHPRARVEERDESELGREPGAVVLDEVADDLHAGHAERPDGRAENVEVTREGRIGHVLDARIERDSPLTLGQENLLDRSEHVLGREREFLDVGPRQEEDLDPLVAHPTPSTAE